LYAANYLDYFAAIHRIALDTSGRIYALRVYQASEFALFTKSGYACNPAVLVFWRMTIVIRQKFQAANKSKVRLRGLGLSSLFCQKFILLASKTPQL
jgi:hypothetical protein